MTFKELLAIYRKIENDLEDAKWDRKYWDEKIAKGEFETIKKETVERFRADDSIKVDDLTAMLRSIEAVEVFR